MKAAPAISDLFWLAQREALERGHCRVFRDGTQVGVVWFSPRGALRSWWESISL